MRKTLKRSCWFTFISLWCPSIIIFLILQLGAWQQLFPRNCTFPLHALLINTERQSAFTRQIFQCFVRFQQEWLVSSIPLQRPPSWRNGKESACQCRRHRRCRFDPWVRKIQWRRKWQPAPVFLSGKSHGQWNQVGYSPWSCGVRHDWTHTHIFHCPLCTKFYTWWLNQCSFHLTSE